MQIFKTNRSTEGYPVGTVAVRLQDLPFGYEGAVTCDVLVKGKVKQVTFARSRLRLVQVVPTLRVEDFNYKPHIRLRVGFTSKRNHRVWWATVYDKVGGAPRFSTAGHFKSDRALVSAMKLHSKALNYVINPVKHYTRLFAGSLY